MPDSKTYLEYINGELCFGPKRRSLATLVKDYAAPIYVYDLQLIRERFATMKAALGTGEIYYAIKANSNLGVLQTLQAVGAGADVVSSGEIRRALEAGFSPQRIIFSGVGKTVREISDALRAGIRQINVESQPELVRIAKIASELSLKAPIALRLNPNIDIKTHPYIATGLHENKFGIELSALGAIESVLEKNSHSLELVGVSLHLGSQMMEFSGFQQALRLLRPVYERLKEKFPTVARFDVGGGVGIFYDQMNIAAEEMLLKQYAEIVHIELADLGCELQAEPGRWLVAHAGVLLTQIQYVKPTPYRNFLVVDSGMNHLMRPALYGAHHSLWPLRHYSNRALAKYDVVGPICESADFFAKDRTLPECFQDEFLVVADVGAYGYSMANTYNLQDLPKEICI